MSHQEPSPRSRILLVAYACSPRHGSEPSVGWHRALQAVRFHDTWVICEERQFGPEIREYLHNHGPIPGLHFEFLPMSSWERRLASTSVLYYLAYNMWHRRAAQRAAELHQRHNFSLVHQVNYCGFREPGYCWQLDLPFIWGPLGGTQNLPWQFTFEIGCGGAIRETVRTLLNRWQLYYRRRVHRAARSARIVLAANTTNQRDLQRALGIEPDVLLETGLARVRQRSGTADGDADSRDPGELRILWSGQFLPFKGLSLLLKALGRLRGRMPYRLRILGQGPMQKPWRRLARKLQIDDCIEWLGWLPHEEAIRQYAWADVFAFTSLRDTTGSVMLESLAAEVPVICLDHQGGHDVITDGCGVRIPPKNPGQVVRDLEDVLLRMSDDPEYLRQLSRGARERACDYLWSRNGECMADVYRQVLAGTREDSPEVEVPGNATCMTPWATEATVSEASTP